MGLKHSMEKDESSLKIPLIKKQTVVKRIFEKLKFVTSGKNGNMRMYLLKVNAYVERALRRTIMSDDTITIYRIFFAP